MKKATKLFLSLISVSLLCISLSIKDEQVTVEAGANGMGSAKKTYSTSKSTYYANAGIKGETGTELLEDLATLMYGTHKTYTSYADIRWANAYSDEDPNDSTKLIDFYSGESISNAWEPSSSWNREHVWCQSLSGGLYGETYGGGDIHHIRPTDNVLNSTRNNRMYAEVNKSTATQLVNKKTNCKTGCYYDNNDHFEPRDAVKGDVARILMYMYTHYSNGVSTNSTNSHAGNLVITNIIYTSAGTTSAAWDLILRWNEADPVDDFEANRNEYCASITGVRNPYIDHPEFAEMIWDTSYTGGGALNDSGTSTTTKCIVTYYMNNGTSDVYQTSGVNKNSTATVPTDPTRDGYIFDGWYTEETTTNAYNFSTPVTANLALYAKWTETTSDDDEEYDYWKLVTQSSDLEVGSKYIIVSKDSGFAMSTTKDDKRYHGSSVIKGNDKITSITSDVQTLTLKDGYQAGTYSFLVNSSTQSYLCLDSEANKLVTKASVDSNSSVTIAVNSDKTVSIKSCAYTSYAIAFNSAYTYFSFYKSNQGAIALYKYIENPNTPSLTISSIKAKLDFDAYYIGNEVYDIKDTKVTIKAYFTSENDLDASYVVIYGKTDVDGRNEVEITPVNGVLSYEIDITNYTDEYEIKFAMKVNDEYYYSLDNESKVFTYKETASKLASKETDTYTKAALEYIAK